MISAKLAVLMAALTLVGVATPSMAAATIIIADPEAQDQEADVEIERNNLI